MKTILAAFFLLSSALSAKSQLPVFEWVHRFGGSNLDRAASIAVDRWGNVLTTGTFYGTVDFDPGPGVANLVMPASGGGGVATMGIYISKLNSAGEYVWAKQLGTPSAGVHGGVYDIAVDARGNVCVAGWFVQTIDFDPGVDTFSVTYSGWASNGFILKLDSAGNFLWAKTFGADELDGAQSVAFDQSGNVLVGGHFGDTVDFDPGPGTQLLVAGGDDGFILKLDSAGNFVWVAQIGGPSEDGALAVIADSAGAVYATGYFQGVVDFDPGAAAVSLTSAGDYDAFLVKFSSAGSLVWAKRTGGVDVERGRGLAIGRSGKLYTVGTFGSTVDFNPGVGNYPLISAGDKDMYVQMLDTAGAFISASRTGGAGYDMVYGIEVDSSGAMYSAGWFSGTVDFDPGPNVYFMSSQGNNDSRGFVSKLSGTGDFEWAYALANGADGLMLGPGATVHCTGTVSQSFQFDPPAGPTLTSAGDRDVFVLKINQEDLTGIPAASLQTSEDFMLSPNPACGALTLHSVGGHLRGANIYLLDIAGRRLASWVANEKIFFVADVQHLIPGSYWIDVVLPNRRKTLQLVKQ